MKTFTHKNKVYITINGKTFYLIRGYERDCRKFIFVQVAGKYTLNKEDLPGKSWEVIRTRVGNRTVYTAYNRSYFFYQGNAGTQHLIFIGADTHGSRFLTVWYLNNRYGLKLKYHKRINFNDYHFSVLEDKGNGNTSAVMVEIDAQFRPANIFKKEV